MQIRMCFCIISIVLLLGDLHQVQAQGTAYKIASTALSLAAGVATAVYVKPEMLYRGINQTIRRLEGKKEDALTSSAGAISVPAYYAQCEQKFNTTCAPLTLDKTARVGVGIATFLVTKRVLRFLR